MLIFFSSHSIGLLSGASPFYFSILFKLTQFIKIQFFSVSGNTSDDEERLVRDLFRGYNKLIRPVQNMTNKVDVKFGLAFVQLINVVSTISTFMHIISASSQYS